MKYILLLVFLLSSCQSAWQVKPEDFARRIDREKNYKLADIYEKKRGLVLIFWQSACPCVKRYEELVRNLYNKYKKNNLEFIYISSNTNESYAQALEEYKKRAMPLKLMRDEGAKLARMLKVQGTPTALLINPQGDVVYMGWIDNERREGEKGRVAYLENALKEYLDGKAISVKTSPMFGCAIY